MNWFERWHEIGREGAKWQEEFLEKYFNPNTYTGIFKAMLYWVVLWYVLCHFYDIMDWFHNLTGGRQSDPVKPSQVSWVRLCASVMCFPPILLTILSLIRLPIVRYRAKRQKQETDAQKTTSEE